MPRGNGASRYGTEPIERVVRGLKPYANPKTGFQHDRVETHDYGARVYVYCTVKMHNKSYHTVFGWLNDRETALMTDEVRVMTLTSVERRELGQHIARTRGLTAASISFW